MPVSITSESPVKLEADWLIVIVSNSESLSPRVKSIDEATGGVITSLVATEQFSCKPLETLCIYRPQGIAAKNIILAGVGDASTCALRNFRHSLLAALRQCCTLPEQTVGVVVDDSVTDGLTSEAIAGTFADAAEVAPVDADIYKARRARSEFANATLYLPAASDAAMAALSKGTAIGQACVIVKNLVNRTANDIYPESFAAESLKLAEAVGLEISILDDGQLAEERMGAMLAVAQGSSRPARLVKLSWHGGTQDSPKIGIVGKGVTFDSGGYSIKPSDSMISMKADMAGAASALGAIIAVAKLKLPVNVTAYLGLVENMISGNAYRLGDVLTARNGTTIEIHNTDAEGRLVLADVLAYAVDDGAEQLVDLATLTGACVIALGEEITGVFAGDSTIAAELNTASQAAGEYFWDMPMHDHFEPLLKSSVADCKNVGPRWGSAITAAKFLQKFVGDTPWVHLDIAGPSWADSGTAWRDAGATADPVRTLVEWLSRKT